MSNEGKALLVTIIFGITDVFFNIIAILSFKEIFVVISIFLSIMLISTLIVLCIKYTELVYSYEFLKILFFGSEYNGFNFFPKLKLYMDYLGKKNQVEVENIEFECISDNYNKTSDVTWVMKNVYNRTNKAIKSYCLYTTSDFGTIDGVDIEVTMGNRQLKIDTDNIKRRNGVQKTPFTFMEPLKPNERIPQIKIKMKMHNAFDFSHQETVILYPRNYGKKVKHIDIMYKTKGIEPLSVKLHEIKRKNMSYVDEPLRPCEALIIGDFTQYAFSLEAREINVENLYYLRILPRSMINCVVDSM